MALSPQDYRKIINIHRIGLAVDRPAFGDVLPGTLYYSVDTGTLERASLTGWQIYSSTGGGGILIPHHVEHEPGGSDALVNVAWTNLRNIFQDLQTIGPLGSEPFLRILDNTGQGARIFLRDLSTIAGIQLGVMRLQGGVLKFQLLNDLEAGISGWEFGNGQLIIHGPVGIPPTFTFSTLGGVFLDSPTIQALSDNSLLITRLGGGGVRNILLAAGFGDTPLDATQLLSGTVPDIRLSPNVLTHPSGYPGGTVDFLRADGTFVTPPSNTGPQGPPGPAGEDGVDGAPGPQGETGPEGPQGIQGIQGPIGPPGDDGVDGADGAQGPPGNDGAQGPQGIQGPIGPQGIPGVDGDDGAQGIQGPIGPQGPKGDTGDQGPQGPQGIPGPNVNHAPTHNTGGADPITALSGTVITTGTVADARLSSNVPLKNVANTFTGVLSATNQPTVSVLASVVQSIPNGAFTPLNFDTEIFDIGDCWSIGSPTRLTVPAGGGGTYLIVGVIAWPNNSLGVRGSVVQKNGTTNIAVVFAPPVNGEITVVQATGIAVLAPGDYVQLLAYQATGVGINTIANSTLQWVKLW